MISMKEKYSNFNLSIDIDFFAIQIRPKYFKIFFMANKYCIRLKVVFSAYENQYSMDTNITTSTLHIYICTCFNSLIRHYVLAGYVPMCFKMQENLDIYALILDTLYKHDIRIPPNYWHQLGNHVLFNKIIETDSLLEVEFQIIFCCCCY